MPTNAFYVLPKEKKDIILDAAKREFSNNLFEDASINQIIKDINMPRGTFYLYFENKEDIYNYVLKSYKETFLKKLIDTLKENNGDIFIALTNMYDYIFENKDNELKKLIDNMFLNMNSRRIENNLPGKECNSEYEKELIQNISMTKYGKNRDDIFVLLSILFPLFIQNIAITLLHYNNKQKIKDNYIKQINIIKRGMEGEKIC